MERLTIDEIIEHCERKTKFYEEVGKSIDFETTELTDAIKEYWEHKQVKEYLEELKRYRDLEEQGLLLRLPTEAYFIKNNNVCKGWVQEVVYSVCRKLLLDIRYDDNSLDSYRGYVGKTVFLTQEEAEQKLKEMERDCNDKN